VRGSLPRGLFSHNSQLVMTPRLCAGLQPSGRPRQRQTGTTCTCPLPVRWHVTHVRSTRSDMPVAGQYQAHIHTVLMSRHEQVRYYTYKDETGIRYQCRHVVPRISVTTVPSPIPAGWRRQVAVQPPLVLLPQTMNQRRIRYVIDHTSIARQAALADPCRILDASVSGRIGSHRCIILAVPPASLCSCCPANAICAYFREVLQHPDGPCPQ
jgi:hypothetical protein